MIRFLAIAFNLLLVPGAGQIAIGRWRRAIPWLVGTALLPVAALVSPWLVLGLIAAVKIGSPIEVGLLKAPRPLAPLQQLAAYGGALVGTVVWVKLMKALVVEAFVLPSVAMVPTFEYGDHVFASKLAYRFGDPERGDLAVFESQCEPGRDFVKRIVGLPGDTIEVRCDILYVDGKAAPSTGLKEDCAYWDRDEQGEWVKRECATYVEELGDHTYEIVHLPIRRERDRLRKVAGAEQSYEELRGDGDFPASDLRPQCPEYMKNVPPAVGRIEPSPAGAKVGACAPRSHYVVPDGHAFVLGDNRENSADSRFWGPVPLDHLKGKVINIWWSSRPKEQGGIAWGRIGPVD